MGPNLITFTYTGVGNTAYNLQAEEGMTWAEWCESEYNTTDIYIDSNGEVYDPEGKYHIVYSSEFSVVKGTDIIIANGKYELG